MFPWLASHHTASCNYPTCFYHLKILASRVDFIDLSFLILVLQSFSLSRQFSLVTQLCFGALWNSFLSKSLLSTYSNFPMRLSFPDFSAVSLKDTTFEDLVQLFRYIFEEILYTKHFKELQILLLFLLNIY